MKYCSKIRCGRLIPESHKSNVCPHCGSGSDSKYFSDTYIKILPPEAYEIEQKCRKCGSTEELCYTEKTDYGSFSIGNYYECKSCRDAWYAEMDRLEAMNYIVINHMNDEIEFYETKDDLEKEFDRMVSDWDYEALEGINENLIVLKVEKIDGLPRVEDFRNRNVIQYDYEWYHVEEIIEPTFEVDGDYRITW